MAWAPDYATSSEMKAYTRISDDVDDAQIALAITAASRDIDRHTNRQFGVLSSAEERFYTGRWDRRRCRWMVDIDDLMTTTGLVVEIVDAGTTTAFTKEHINAAAMGRPWTSIVFDTDSTYLPTGEVNEVSVTARWGWTTVPDPIKQATLLQANRILSRRNSPYGIAGSPEQGNELRLLARVDPDVAVVLGPYIRWWGAA